MPRAENIICEGVLGQHRRIQTHGKAWPSCMSGAEQDHGQGTTEQARRMNLLEMTVALLRCCVRNCEPAGSISHSNIPRDLRFFEEYAAMLTSYKLNRRHLRSPFLGQKRPAKTGFQLDRLASWSRHPGEADRSSRCNTVCLVLPSPRMPDEVGPTTFAAARRLYHAPSRSQ